VPTRQQVHDLLAHTRRPRRDYGGIPEQ
jgi:hypothetical protein